MNDLSKSLIPTKEEITEILKQVSQAQMEQPDLKKLPVAILQAWSDCVMRKAFNQIEGEYNKPFNQFKDKMIKPAEQFGNEVDKAINQYKDALEKAIKKFKDEASR